MSRGHDKMVFNYVLPTEDASVPSYYDYPSTQVNGYYAQSTPRDIPRPSRYTGTVAPADLYTNAIAPPPMMTMREPYNGRQASAAAGYPSPPDEYGDRLMMMSKRESVVGSSRHSSFDERSSPQEFEMGGYTSRGSRRFYCELPGCVDENGKQRSAGRKADLKRHMDTVHGQPTIDCEYKKCTRRGEDGFRRDDHYKEHLRGYHNAPIPKADRTRRGS